MCVYKCEVVYMSQYMHKDIGKNSLMYFAFSEDTSCIRFNSIYIYILFTCKFKFILPIFYK